MLRFAFFWVPLVAMTVSMLLALYYNFEPADMSGHSLKVGDLSVELREWHDSGQHLTTADGHKMFVKVVAPGPECGCKKGTPGLVTNQYLSVGFFTKHMRTAA